MVMLINGGDIFYGDGTHNADGTPQQGKITWQFSDSLTGTNDWTEISMEFICKDVVNSIFLEQYGTGQSWFDNVILEDLGEAAPEDNFINDSFNDDLLSGWNVPTEITATVVNMSGEDGALKLSANSENSSKISRALTKTGGQWIIEAQMQTNMQKCTLLAMQDVFNIEVNQSNLTIKTGDETSTVQQTLLDSDFNGGTPFTFKIGLDFDTDQITLSYNGQEQVLKGNYFRKSVDQLSDLLILTGSLGDIYVRDLKVYAATDAGSVLISKDDLTLPGINLAAVTQNIALPSEGINGTQISWKSNNLDVITDAGEVIRSETDGSAVLTATITKGAVTDEKSFSVTVPAFKGRSVNWIEKQVQGSSASVCYDIQNDVAQPLEAVLICAVYGADNNLLAVQTEELALVSGESSQIHMALDWNGTASELKTLLWDNLNNMQPLSAPLYYQVEEIPMLRLTKATAEVGEPIAFEALAMIGGVVDTLTNGSFNISGEGIVVDYEEKTITGQSEGLKTLTLTTSKASSSTMLAVNDSAKTALVQGNEVYTQNFEDDSSLAEYCAVEGDFLLEDKNGDQVLSTQKASATKASNLIGPELSDYMVELDYAMVEPKASGADGINIGLRAASNKDSYRMGYFERWRFDQESVLYDRAAISRGSSSDLSKAYYVVYSDQELGIRKNSSGSGGYYNTNTYTIRASAAGATAIYSY